MSIGALAYLAILITTLTIVFLTDADAAADADVTGAADAITFAAIIAFFD